MKTVNLTIVGTCTGDPGRGGWAFVLRMGEHSMERTGGSPQTTKAQMEMNAVIRGPQGPPGALSSLSLQRQSASARWHRTLARGVAAHTVHPGERALAPPSSRWRPVGEA